MPAMGAQNLRRVERHMRDFTALAAAIGAITHISPPTEPIRRRATPQTTVFPGKAKRRKKDKAQKVARRVTRKNR